MPVRAALDTAILECLRILFLSPRQAWPPHTGAKLREHHFARALGQHGELTYLFFTEPGLTLPSRADLPFAKEVVPVTQPHLYSPSRLAKGLLGRWPLPVVNYTSVEMHAAIAKVLQKGGFDAVHLDSIHMAGYEASLHRALPRAGVFYNWHNIESELMLRYAQTTASWSRKTYARVTAPRLASAERTILRTARGHVVCSERERALLEALAPQARVAIIANGVDTPYYSAARSATGPRHRIVFVGSMRYHANIDATQWFAREIWPRIHDRFPQWRLTLVGWNPVREVRALETLAGVEVTGTVDDVRPYYSEALAAIAPLRHGGGTRLKILEAMAAGVPVVSSTLGAEGLSLTPGKDILIADTEEQWMDALASLADSQILWDSLSQVGSGLVEHGYDWDVLGRKLYETYRDWLP